MADSEHTATYDCFLSNHTTSIDQSFSPDQSRSLQGLLSAHHAYLFRCVYEMETHLEVSLEELKSRQSKAEKEIAKINLLVENTRCNVLAVAKKLDEAIHAYSGKSDIPQEREARGRDGNSESPGYSDSSTLRSSPNERPRKRKLSTISMQSNANPFDLGLEPEAFHANGSTVRNFGILPSVTSTIAPATWHPSSDMPYLSPGSNGSSMPNSSPGPSTIPFPPISAVNPSDMNIETSNHSDLNPEPAHRDHQPDLPCDQDCSDDEEIVAMQLFAENPSSSPAKPSRPSAHNPELTCNDALHPLSSPLKNCSLPRPHATPDPPARYFSPPMPPSRQQSPTRAPSIVQDPYRPQAQEQTEMQMEIETPALGPEPASEPLLPPEFGPEPELALTPQGSSSVAVLRQQSPSPLQLSFTEWMKSMSPLSDLTDTSVDDDIPFSEIQFVKREEEEQTVAATSISAVTAAQLKLEDRRQKKRIAERARRQRKKLEALALKTGPQVKANDNKTRTKLRARTVRVNEAMTSTENGRKRTRRSGTVKKKGTVVWPEMYMGDEKDEFYRKLIECELCSCWYHYGCAGITPGDVRLESSEVYVCPVCRAATGENKTKDKKSCCRPDCQNQVAPGEYFVSGIAGRKLRYDVDGNIKVLYLVKWDGYAIYEATWESVDTLPDPDNLIEAFQQACMREELLLDTPEPVLLSEAQEWKTVLALTDPPGVKVPLVPSVPIAVA